LVNEFVYLWHYKRYNTYHKLFTCYSNDISNTILQHYCLLLSKTSSEMFYKTIAFISIKENNYLLHEKTLYELITDHNKLCLDIELHNRFWRNVYFIMCYTLIPMYLIVIYMVLFENVQIIAMFTGYSLIIYTVLSHISLNFMTFTNQY